MHVMSLDGGARLAYAHVCTGIYLDVSTLWDVNPRGLTVGDRSFLPFLSIVIIITNWHAFVLFIVMFGPKLPMIM